MTTENIGEIVISPRVLEVITGIAATKVDGVHSLVHKTVTDSLSKTTLAKGVYLTTDEDGNVIVDIYLYMEYGSNVPSISIAIQEAVKSAVNNMAEVTISKVNIHVEGMVSEKTPKPDMSSLFDEDFLDD